MDAWLDLRFNGFSTGQVQMVQPSIQKSHKHSNVTEIHFYRFVQNWLAPKSLFVIVVFPDHTQLLFCNS